MCEVRHLEASHRSVPYYSLSIFYSVCKQFFCFRSDIQTFPAIRNLSTWNNFHVAVVREFITDSVIYRQKQFYTFFCCFFLHIQSILQIVIFTQGYTDCTTFCFCESISHTTADDQSIYFIQQVVDYGNLAGNFCSTQDSNEWSFRVVYCIAKEIDLFLHQISNNSSIYIFCNTYVRAVSSVSGSECIVYENITQGSQFFGEFVSVFGFFCTITGVLQKDYFAVFHSFYSCFCVWSDNFRISCKFYFLSQQFAQSYCNRCQR